MDQRTSAPVQFIDITGAVMAAMLCLGFTAAGVWWLFDREWKIGCAGVLMGGAMGFRAIAYYRSFRSGAKADREFEAKHAGALDWKGDPIESAADDKDA